MTNKDPELSPRSVATSSHWHLLTHHSPKRKHWSQSELRTAQAIPGICHLLEVWTPASAPNLPPPQLSGMFMDPPSLLTHATTLANSRRQVPLDGSLTRQHLRYPLHPAITHIPSALIELSHINTSFGI